MSEYRSILEDARERFAPPEMPLEGVLRRRDHKHRNQRITAGVVGLAIGLVAILIGASIFRSSPKVPANPKPTPVMGNGPITVFGFTGGLRSLSLDGRHERSLVRCQGSCTLVSSAAWSPDGTQVAFSATCSGGCGSAGDPYHGIRVVDLATGKDRKLVSGELFSPSLDWSPDGSQISYVAEGRIHIMDADGSNRTVLPGTSDPVVTASWSPDGAHFAHASGGALSVIGVDGSEPSVIVPSTHPALFSLTWSPDGTHIAYRTGCDVWVTTADGQHQTRIADLRSIVPGARCGSDLGSSEELAWSPDGQQIAVFVEDGRFQRVVLMQVDGKNVRVLSQVDRKFRPFGIAWQPTPTPTPAQTPAPRLPPLRHGNEVLVPVCCGKGLQAVDPATGNARVLVDCPDPCKLGFDQAAWSPDGTRVAYSVPCSFGFNETTPCRPEASRDAGIWVMDAVNGPQELTPYFGSDVPAYPTGEFAWSPDGSKIAYAQVAGTPGLYVANADLFGRRQLPGTEAANMSMPVWSPDGMQITYATGDRVYVTSIDGGAPALLSDVPGHDPAWSPNGAQIAFAGTDGIYVTDAGGGTPVRIGNGYEFVWSPDGTRIVYHVEERGDHGFHEEMWIVSPDGSNATSILPVDCCPGGIVDDTMTWSPDGTQVAFLDSADPVEIWLLTQADGSDAIRTVSQIPHPDGIQVQSWNPCLCSNGNVYPP
jgi:Tol biopolymer transport system component